MYLRNVLLNFKLLLSRIKTVFGVRNMYFETTIIYKLPMKTIYTANAGLCVKEKYMPMGEMGEENYTNKISATLLGANDTHEKF